MSCALSRRSSGPLPPGERRSPSATAKCCRASPRNSDPDLSSGDDSSVPPVARFAEHRVDEPLIVTRLQVLRRDACKGVLRPEVQHANALTPEDDVVERGAANGLPAQRE